jgi:predicted DNA-binding protein
MESAMHKYLTVPLPDELDDWVKREAARLDRPKAYVVRRCIEAARREAQTERAAA